MHRINILLASLVLLLAAGCGRQESAEVTLADPQQRLLAEQQLVNLVDDYFEARLALDPIGAPFLGDFRYNDRLGNDLTDQFLKARHDLNIEYLQRARTLDRTHLSAERHLTLEIFIYDREMDLHLETYPARFLPFNQFYSRINTFVQLGTGESAQPFNSAKDYDDFLQRVDDFTLWVDTAIERMREGTRSRVVLPKVLVERIIPQLETHIVDKPEESLFFGPVKRLPADWSDEERIRIATAYRGAIYKQIVPAFQKLHYFLTSEYLPVARSSDGYWGLPNGKAWYQALANYHTTTQIPVDEIHQIGLDEVARILDEMDKVRQQVSFEGSLPEFFDYLSSDPAFFFSSPQALVDGYDQLREQINQVLPAYFSAMPKTDYEVRPVEAFRQRSAAGASYQAGAPDGSRPGIFYINTYNLMAQPIWGMTTLSLHEAAPGHHFQISLQQELQGLPKYQQFANATAFVEGWALYAEELGIEMGLFSDPYQYFGKLSDEMLRAMRLVVDTGLHAKGWSREQAIQYMLDNSAMAESDVIAEVERYMAIPGQALSYKVGQLKILELRARAERELGEQFDIKSFHQLVLKDGSVPMGLLEQKVERWIDAR